MLNNLTILSVVVTLFVYFGGKNVPKELSKYKLLIVGFTCGLIICSFVKRNVETFTVGGWHGDSAGQCVIHQQSEFHDPQSDIYNDINQLHDRIDLCKHEYMQQLRLAGRLKTTTLKGTSINQAAHDTSRVKDEEWCSNPANINTDDICYNCAAVLSPNNVPKDPEDPYSPSGQCFRCSGLGGSNRWRSTACPRDPSYCSPIRRMSGMC